MATSPLNVGGWMHTNWNANAQPVAVLNEASGLHDRVAYCYGLAANAKALIDVLETNGDGELSAVCALVSSYIEPMVAVLDVLGSETRNSGGAA